jgi:hypothetical protein
MKHLGQPLATMDVTPRRYRLTFFCESALRLKTLRRFKGPGYVVALTDFQQERQGGWKDHGGIEATVGVSADDMFGAIRAARAVVRRIFDQLAFTHTTAIQDPRLYGAFGPGSEELEVEVAQAIRNSPRLRETRRLFEEKRCSKESRKLAKRVDRALHYLRRSYLEDDDMDRFEDLISGLFAIDSALAKRFNQPMSRTVECGECKQPLRCPNCSQPRTDSKEWAGIEHVVTQVLGKPEARARELRQKRNDIAHGTKEPAKLLDGLGPLAELAHRTLTEGVRLLLESPPAETDAERGPLGLQVSPDLLVTYTLHGCTVDEIKKRRLFPSVKLLGIEALVLRAEAANDSRNIEGANVVLEAENFDEEWSTGYAYPRSNSDLEFSDHRDESLLLRK